MGILLGFVDASHDENRIAEALARAEAAERELATLKAALAEEKLAHAISVRCRGCLGRNALARAIRKHCGLEE